jgi:hypothetical protein
MNVFLTEKAMVKVFQKPDGQMIVASNISPDFLVEVIPVLNFSSESMNAAKGLEFRHEVNGEGMSWRINSFGVDWES